MKLQFKFRRSTSQAARERIIGALDESGASVQPLFPDETDAELAALYTVSVQKEDVARRLLALLNASREVEFAEPEVRRKLIR